MVRGDTGSCEPLGRNMPPCELSGVAVDLAQTALAGTPPGTLPHIGGHDYAADHWEAELSPPSLNATETLRHANATSQLSSASGMLAIPRCWKTAG